MQFVPVPDPLLAPTWVTAVFTIVLAVGAIVTAIFAFLAFRKQSQQVRLLQKQVTDDESDRRREAEERRRSRAALVYVTANFQPAYEPGPDVIAVSHEAAVEFEIHNTGSQPVYDVRIHWVDAAKGSQAGEASAGTTLTPTSTYSGIQMLPAGTAPSDFIPVVYFRDAAGVGWTLLADGHLYEVDPAIPPGAPVIATAAVARSREDRGA
jgi:hypothetical protein